jgi:hypothetical protein
LLINVFLGSKSVPFLRIVSSIQNKWCGVYEPAHNSLLAKVVNAMMLWLKKAIKSITYFK